MSGKICANEYTIGNTGNVSIAIRCVANWEITQTQVIFSFYTLCGLFVFASFWVLFSRRQKRKLKKDEIGFSLSLRRWARTSRAAAIIVSLLNFCN
jgi:potassium large conductance calcium-activated channel subfamily M alpha protein 1